MGWQRAGKSADEYENQIAMGYIETTDPGPLTVLQLHPAVGMCTTVRRTDQHPLSHTRLRRVDRI